MLNYITNNQALEEIVEFAREKNIVAIDTEFTREKTYYPILSLIQIAVGDKSFAIDCMSGVDLQPVYDIISDKNIKKILHSCAQDLQIFHQKSKNLPRFVHDVQMMANFCGIGFNVGYSTLTKELLGVEIDKKLQRSNWQKRPLDKKQIEYALLDVVYLEEIYLQLQDKLREKKREKWFEEEMGNVTSYVLSRNEENLFKNFSGESRIRKDAKDIAKIKNLILWREEMAKKKDVPRQHFLSDREIEKIVMQKDFAINIKKNAIEEIKFLLEEIEKSDIKLDFADRKTIMNEMQKARFNRAKNIVAKIAEECDLKEQFLLTNQALKDIVLEKKKINEIILGWRYYLFGRKLEKLM